MSHDGDLVNRAIAALGDDAGLLTGYTTRLLGALVWLREAWAVGDPDNRAGVEAAILHLLSTHSGRRNRELWYRVLGLGFDDPGAIVEAIAARQARVDGMMSRLAAAATEAATGTRGCGCEACGAPIPARAAPGAYLCPRCARREEGS